MSHSTETVIVGAGPGGLAVGGRLSRLSQPFVLLEKSGRVAPAWHNHYDRLHLHTVKTTSYLPHKPFPDSFPQYIPRQLLADYYDSYAAEMNLHPRLNESVQSVKWIGNQWQTTTDKETYQSRFVVIATGFNRIPHVPIWPEQDRFQGTITHSCTYKNGQAWRDKNILVVGMGNTGAEIALDLMEHGARPAISVRGPINVVPRDVLGRPTQLTGMLLAKLPDNIGDSIGVLLRRLTVGDLSRYGIETPSEPPAAQLRNSGKTPVIDIGTIKAIKNGDIIVRPEIRSFTDDGVVFRDGASQAFDHVVLATGYRPQIGDFVADTRNLLNQLGHPANVVAPDPHRGLFFIGFNAYVTGGILYTILQDSELIANHITEQRQ